MYCRDEEYLALYVHSLIYLHGVVLYLHTGTNLLLLNHGEIILIFIVVGSVKNCPHICNTGPWGT